MPVEKEVPFTRLASNLEGRFVYYRVLIESSILEREPPVENGQLIT